MSIENVTSEAIRRLVDGIFDKQQAAARILIFLERTGGTEVRDNCVTGNNQEIGHPVTEPMPGRPFGSGSVTADNPR